LSGVVDSDAVSFQGRRSRITCSFRFEAAHRLPLHRGKCKELHGHGYRLEVTLEGPIGANGMVLDFSQVEEVVEERILSRWDHSFLNDAIEHPTAEVLACLALDLLLENGLPVVSVKVFETPDQWAEARP